MSAGQRLKKFLSFEAYGNYRMKKDYNRYCHGLLRNEIDGNNRLRSLPHTISAALDNRTYIDNRAIDSKCITA